ncbi:MAG: heavy-metal-associated domain-containing protein [Flavobacterium sp.]|nr:heavy-metal-associated domain-containing protein [Flavobacterium sp.]
MKITKSILAFAIAGTMIVGCKKQETKVAITENTPKNIIAANANLAITTFNIDGMTCAVGCAKTIEKELTETAGVKSASVDFEKKSAKIEYDCDAQSPEKLVNIVEKTGDGKTYKVSNVKNSQDKAMLYDQEDPKKPKNKKSDKTVYIATSSNATTIIPTEKPAGKSGCCAAKKHCTGDEKKDNL